MFSKKGKQTDIKNSVVRFSDAKRDPLSRVKHLRFVFDGCGNDADKKRFLEEYYHVVFQIFFELFHQAQSALVVRSLKVTTNVELESALWLLENILNFLPELLSSRWQYYAMEAVIKRCLHPSNIAGLRRLGLKYFLLWYQILGIGPYGADNLDLIFSMLVPFLPTQMEGRSSEAVLQQLCENPPLEQVLVPSDCPVHPSRLGPVMPVLAEAEQKKGLVVANYIDKMIEYIVKDSEKVKWTRMEECQLHCLNFLIDKLKAYYIPVFLPKMKLLDVYNPTMGDIFSDPTAIVDEVGRKNLTQVEIAEDSHRGDADDILEVGKHCLVRWFISYLYSYKKPSDSLERDRTLTQISPDKSGEKCPPSYDLVRRVLFSSKPNINLCLSILKEGLRMPTRYCTTMLKITKVLRDWASMNDPVIFMLEPTPGELGYLCAGLQKTLQTLIEVGAAFFFNPALLYENHPGSDTASVSEQQADVGKRVLSLYRIIVMQVVMTRETWLLLLVTLKRIVQFVIFPIPPVNRVDIFTGKIAGHLFQTLIVTWVRASLNVQVPNEMWDDLLACLSQLTSWPELIEEWGKTIGSLTRTLSYHVYGVDLSETPLEAQQEHKIRRLRAQSSVSPSAQESSSGSSTVKFSRGWSLKEPERTIGATTTSSTEASDSGVSEGSVASKVRQMPSVAEESLTPTESTSTSDPHSSTSPPVVTKNLLRRTKAHSESATSDQNTNVLTDEMSGSEISEAKDGESLDMAADAAIETLSMEGVSLEESSSLDSTCMDVKTDNGSLTHHKSVFDRGSATPSPTPEEDGNFDDYCTPDESPSSLPSPALMTNVNGDTKSVMAGGSAPGWQADVAVVLWRRVLGLLGNINGISDPDVHRIAIKTVAEFVDLLLQVRTSQGILTGDSGEDANEFAPPVIVILPLLFETVQLPERYVEGKLIAVESLCKTIIRRNDFPIPEDYLIQFYSCLHELLRSENERFVDICVRFSAPRVFEMGLAGCLVLSMDYLRACQSVLFSLSPKVCRFEAAWLTASFVGLSHMFSVQNRAKVKQLAGCDLPDLRRETVGILTRTLNAVAESNVRLAVLKGLVIFLVEEISSPSRQEGDRESDDLITSTCETLTTEIKGGIVRLHSIMEIVELVQTLTSLMQNVPEAKLTLFVGIIEAYCELLDSILNSTAVKRTHSKLCSTLLIFLAEWCLVIPFQLFAATIVRKTFETLQRCLALTSSEEPRAHDIISAALTAQGILLECLNQWPITCSSAVLQCSTVADNRKNVVDFVNGEMQLISVGIELLLSFDECCSDDGGNRVAQVMSRQLPGKRCWDFRRLSQDEFADHSDFLRSELSSRALPVAHKSSVSSHSSNTTGTNPASFSISSSLPSSETCGSDVLSEALAFVGAKSPECLLIQGLPLNQIMPSPPEIGDLADKLGSSLSQFSLKSSEMELNCWSCGDSARVPGDVTSFQLCKKLASHLNMDNFEKSNQLSLLDKSDRLLRELKHLDSRACRETHKIAVVYVAEGQNDKTAILGNTCGSKAFEKFVANLGWEVDLSTHSGYMGGLPVGKGTSVYYSTPILEVMFHISTRLPSDDITKKLRHLGNDEVQVVWSEHYRDYRRSIIATDFCDVLIVIYPLSNTNLVRIQIEAKPDIGDFGPLFDGALVTFSSLAILVRATVVNAGRAKRRTIPLYKNFYEERWSNLESVREKLSMNISYREYLSRLSLPSDITVQQNTADLYAAKKRTVKRLEPNVYLV